jgi:hypothetical protein
VGTERQGVYRQNGVDGVVQVPRLVTQKKRNGSNCVHGL